MKTITTRRFFQYFAAIFSTSLFIVACESSGETPFGKPCATGADCMTGLCVGGETGTTLAPFCSDDCTGRKSGDACGEKGQGRCIADFVSWCWMMCEMDDECATVNPERPVCSITSSSGVDAPFKVCIGKPKS